MKGRPSSLISRQIVGGMQHRMSRAISLLAVGFSLAICNTVCVASDPSDGQLYDIDIPSLNAAEALNSLAEQTGAIMLFPFDLAETRQANAVRGRFTLMDALSELLEDSGLSSGLSDKRVIQITLDEPVDHKKEEEEMATEKVSFRSKVGTFFASLLIASGAGAQESADTGEAELEEIIVTGTHIEGLSELALAVTVLNEDAIRDLGAVNMFDLLAYIPAISDFEFDDANNGTNGVRGDVAGVNMRSLGTGNTLVLIDGRRMVVHPTFQAINSVPSTLYNVNAIPASSIRRVEVLRDGASAVYGADASAGVVNFITRRGQEGIEVSAKFGASSATDYDETEITARGGWSLNGGGTNISLFATYYDRSSVHISELGDLHFDLDRRNHPAIPEEWQGDSQLRNTSTRTPYAQVSVGALDPDLEFVGSTFHVDPTTGALVAGSSSERYNFNETAWVTPAVDRFNFMATLDHGFANGMSFFGDASYYQSTSNTQRAASPIDDGLAFLIVPSTGFYNTTGQDALITRWRPIDLGPRLIEVEQDVYRLLAGLRGDLGDWSWESALMHSAAEATDIEGNRQAKSLFVNQVSVTDASALNPFAGPGGNSQDALDAIRIDARNVTESEITMWDLRFNNNELFSMPGGPAGFATGLEWRRDYFKDDRDPRLDGSQPFQDGPIFDESDVIGVSASFDSSASRNTTSLYGELFLPLVGEQTPSLSPRRLSYSLLFGTKTPMTSVTRPSPRLCFGGSLSTVSRFVRRTVKGSVRRTCHS